MKITEEELTEFKEKIAKFSGECVEEWIAEALEEVKERTDKFKNSIRPPSASEMDIDLQNRLRGIEKRISALESSQIKYK